MFGRLDGSGFEIIDPSFKRLVIHSSHVERLYPIPAEVRRYIDDE